MTTIPDCPACGSTPAHHDGVMLVRPRMRARVEGWRRRRGRGSARSALKAGTKVRNIRLVDEDHDIDCRIDGFGPMKLKSEFVRKA